MSSVFFEQYNSNGVPVSYLLHETIIDEIEKAGNESGVPVADIVEAAISRIFPEVTTDDDVLSMVANRVLVTADGTVETNHVKHAKKGKSFASAYQEWAESMSPEMVCMYVSGYAWEEAAHLYSYVDKDHVKTMADAKFKCEWERINIAYESVIYGMGGSYKNDGSHGDEDTVDLSQGNESGIEQLVGMLKL